MLLNKGNFLKATEVKNGDIVTIKDAGVVQESDQFKTKLPDGREVPKKQYVFSIEIKGEDKNLTMNKMSRDNLCASYGNNTEEWIGKKATIELCLFSNGKRGIVLSPISEVAHEDEEPPMEETPF